MEGEAVDFGMVFQKQNFASTLSYYMYNIYCILSYFLLLLGVSVVGLYRTVLLTWAFQYFMWGIGFHFVQI